MASSAKCLSVFLLLLFHKHRTGKSRLLLQSGASKSEADVKSMMNMNILLHS